MPVFFYEGVEGMALSVIRMVLPVLVMILIGYLCGRKGIISTCIPAYHNEELPGTGTPMSSYKDA